MSAAGLRSNPPRPLMGPLILRLFSLFISLCCRGFGKEEADEDPSAFMDMMGEWRASERRLLGSWVEWGALHHAPLPFSTTIHSSPSQTTTSMHNTIWEDAGEMG
jgi:hypothetical protein